MKSSDISGVSLHKVLTPVKALLPLLLMVAGVVALVHALFVSPATAADLKSIVVRYRVDVTLTYKGEVLSGSTVWQLSEWMEQTENGPLPNFEVRGEAIPVPTQDGGVIFVLKRGFRHGGSSSGIGNGNYLRDCLADFGNPRGPEPIGPDMQALQAFRGPCDVDASPELIFLPDRQKPPNTLTLLSSHPDGGDQDTPALQKFVMTATSDAITTGIVAQYPWIANLPRPELGYGVLDPLLRLLPGGRWSGFINSKTIYLMDFTTEY